MVSQDIIDYLPRFPCFFGWIDAWQLGKLNEGFPQRPTTASRPSRVIDRKRCAKYLAVFAFEKRPRDRQIACRIAHAKTAKVDNGAQPAILDQQVARADIAVEPNRRIAPNRRQRRLPRRAYRVGIDLTIKSRDRLPDLTIINGQRPAAEKVARPGRRTAGSIDLPKGGKESSQGGSELL